MPSIGANFDWVDTPNPIERAFAIVAKEGPTDAIPDYLTAPVLWSACPAWIKKAESVPDALQGYTLVHCEKAGFQKRRFIFGRTRTETERATAFKTEWIKRPKDWPTVLLKLWAQKGKLPLSTVDAAGNVQTTDRLHERMSYRHGGVFPTWHRVRHFLSERPFPKQSSQQVPITDSIHWSFDGFSGSVPECLHPGVTVPHGQGMGAVLFGFGTPSSEIGGDLVRQHYPPTPMQDWEKHVIEDTPTAVFGERSTMSYRRLVEVFPPLDDREIKI